MMPHDSGDDSRDPFMFRSVDGLGAESIGLLIWYVDVDDVLCGLWSALQYVGLSATYRVLWEEPERFIWCLRNSQNASCIETN